MISLQDLIDELGITWREYRSAELAVHGALAIGAVAPAEVDCCLEIPDTAYAYTMYRVGGYKTGAVIVESYLPDGLCQISVGAMAALEHLYECCPVLQSFPLGRLGHRAAARLLVDRRNRQVYVVDCHHFEAQFRPNLPVVLKKWGGPPP